MDHLKIIQKFFDELRDLLNQSQGVAGLHLNGDVAPWEDLLPGGKYEDWLLTYDDAHKALTELFHQAKEAKCEKR